jgi:hypothetical protein
MKTLRSAIVAMGLLLAVSGAYAQSINVGSKVPFDFVVGKQVLPAGEYSLQSVEPTPGVLTIRNTEARAFGLTMTHPCEKLNPAKKTVLVFHRLGDQYFLSEVWVEGNTRGITIPQSPLEIQMAKNHETRGEVIVAANINSIAYSR